MSQTRVLDLINKGFSQKRFLEIYQKPALLFSTIEQENEDSTVETDIRNITDTDILSCMEQPEAPAAKFTNSRIFFLEKSCRSPQTPEIILGRDKTSDIIVSLPSVSKRHAYFVENWGDWFIVDNKSTNGTNVDNTRIKPFERFSLRDNSKITFGFEAIARFFTPVGLWGVLCLYNGLNFIHTPILED